MPFHKLNKLLNNNKIWSQQTQKNNPDLFKTTALSQKPKYLWIGCSDSRMPAESIVGLKPGELFVHRNIANQVPLNDINCLSVIQYAVQVLKVSDIIVAGHYKCGGIKAAFQRHDHGSLQAWLAHIRDIRIRFRDLLKSQNAQENENLLVQLNVKQQVYDIAKIPSVQKAWKNGQQIRIHGVVYQLQNGRLKDLGLTLSNLQMIPQQFWICGLTNKQIVEKRQRKQSMMMESIRISKNKQEEQQNEDVRIEKKEEPFNEEKFYSH